MQQKPTQKGDLGNIFYGEGNADAESSILSEEIGDSDEKQDTASASEQLYTNSLKSLKLTNL